MLKLIGKPLVAGLIAMMFAIPVMACVLPNAALTPEEKACCRQMAGQCGNMGLSSSHSCCKSTLGYSVPFVVASRPGTAPHFQELGFIVADPGFIQSQRSPLIEPLAHTHSPPIPLQENTSILRI